MLEIVKEQTVMYATDSHNLRSGPLHNNNMDEWVYKATSSEKSELGHKRCLRESNFSDSIYEEYKNSQRQGDKL